MDCMTWMYKSIGAVKAGRTGSGLLMSNFSDFPSVSTAFYYCGNSLYNDRDFPSVSTTSYCYGNSRCNDRDFPLVCAASYYYENSLYNDGDFLLVSVVHWVSVSCITVGNPSYTMGNPCQSVLALNTNEISCKATGIPCHYYYWNSQSCFMRESPWHFSGEHILFILHLNSGIGIRTPSGGWYAIERC